MPFQFSLFALLAANLVPLIGVLFFGWDSMLVLALFWIENLIIGAFNLIKMLTITVRDRILKGVFLSLFFVVHYGLFCAAHGKLLAKLLEIDNVSQLGQPSIGGPFGLYWEAAALVMYFIGLYSSVILLGVFALLMSHLVSFIENFILRGGVFNQNVGQLMGKPYGQIMIMHAGLLIGAIALQKLGSPVWLLAMIVALKISVDLAQYKRRHKTVDNKELIKDL